MICFRLNLCSCLSRKGSVEEACMPFSTQHKVNILPYCSHKVLILPPALCWLICQLLLLCWWAPPNRSCFASGFFSEVNEWQAESWCSRATAKVVQEKLTEEALSFDFSLCRSPPGSNLTTESPFPLVLTTTCLELPLPWLAGPMNRCKNVKNGVAGLIISHRRMLFVMEEETNHLIFTTRGNCLMGSGKKKPR